MGNLCGSCVEDDEHERRRTRRKKGNTRTTERISSYQQQRRWRNDSHSMDQAEQSRGGFVTSSSSSSRWKGGGQERSMRKSKLEEALIHELLQQSGVVRNGNGIGSRGGLFFDRSSSLRTTSMSNDGVVSLPRSSSSRPRSSADPLLKPQHLVNQDLIVDALETRNFILVHGGGFGAWCWYKTITLLEGGGFSVTAIDLTGSGIDCFDTNNITSLSQYVKPLTDFLEKLIDGEKVILVGHDFGGVCISYAMEAFPSKVAKAVFISAAMLTNGQSALDLFSEQAHSNDLMQKAQLFLYANGCERPPTSIDLDKSLLRELLFNQSPSKDVALASVSMRPIPFAPVLEKLSLSSERYGSVRRFFIETGDDNAIPASVQQSLIKANPPELAYRLSGSDHSPFFSKPQALHKHLVEIAKI